MSNFLLSSLNIVPLQAFVSESAYGLLHGIPRMTLIYLLVGFVVSFLIGLVLGRLLFGGKGGSDEDAAISSAESETRPAIRKSEDNEELEWRHEKLALTEQQMADRHRRLGNWIDSMGEDDADEALQYPGGCLFFLSESIREERNQIGSDLSRFSLAEKRVGKLSDEMLPVFGEGLVPESLTEWRQNAKDCLEDVGRHSEILRDRQKRLREIFSHVSELEESVAKADRINPEMLDASKEKLDEIWRELGDLPGGGIHEVTAKLDKRILELLEDPPKDDPDSGIKVPEYRFTGLQRILAVDGGVSGTIGKAALLAAAERTRSAFSELNVAEKTVEAEVIEEQSAAIAPVVVSSTKEDDEPVSDDDDGDSNIVNTLQDEAESDAEEKEDEEEKEEESVAAEIEADEPFSIIVFCANNPEWWNKNLYRGAKASVLAKSRSVPEGVKVGQHPTTRYRRTGFL